MNEIVCLFERQKEDLLFSPLDKTLSHSYGHPRVRKFSTSSSLWSKSRKKVFFEITEDANRHETEQFPEGGQRRESRETRQAADSRVEVHARH